MVLGGAYLSPLHETVQGLNLTTLGALNPSMGPNRKPKPQAGKNRPIIQAYT